MADLQDILNGTTNMIASTLSLGGILNLAPMTRGLIIDLQTIRIDDMHNFNMRNYAYMQAHMLRNLHEKEVTLGTLGENAYIDGNPDNFGTIPQKPSYTDGNNYIDFMTNVRLGEATGALTTRVTAANTNPSNRPNLFNVSHKYFDAPDGTWFNQEPPAPGGPSVENSAVNFTGSLIDRNSILYKTQLLYRQNKINTIISSFHTSPNVYYEGQVGTEYGESRGRNLLTKSAENGQGSYNINGYDNPYCRVWTHHYMYDRLSKTMRANSGGINYWGDAFEWNKDDIGHEPSKHKDSIGENYDYAWRGKLNQARRLANSVLDLQRGVNGEAPTGLPIITPKYRGGGSKNIHTKSCMFSIENLAWKDYDPYSFEQALSWEQRGPFGGRIMWFPPYDLSITETSSARWNTNEFIGRGESVYTYVNSERSGSLSFLMLTDHPSSIDYSSWWDANGLIEGVDDGMGASDTDYLRYFAGCMGNGKSGQSENEDEDNIIEKPTPMTDEYKQIEFPAIIGEIKKTEEINIDRDATVPPDPVFKQPPENNPETVEFYMFFPNNYSGVLDTPANTTGKYNPDGPAVDAIAYLLAGRGGQKTDGYHDNQLRLTDITTDMSDAIGYEMDGSGISNVSTQEYIQGGKNVSKGTWQIEPNKKWGYRIDHVQQDKNPRFVNGDYNGVNTVNQSIQKRNYKDNASFRYNLDVTEKVKELSKNPEHLYSFAEVAAAMYSPEVLDMAGVYTFLYQKLNNDSKERVKKLVELFSNSEDRELESIECCGVSNQHGKQSRNVPLAKNRSQTIVSWIHSNPKWANVLNTLSENDSYKSDVQVTDEDKRDVNGASAKLFRSAKCVMKFSPSKTIAATQNNPDTEASSSEYFRMIPFWAPTTEYTGHEEYVQYEGDLYVSFCESDDCTGFHDINDTDFWEKVEAVSDYNKEESYPQGAFIRNNGYIYETLQEIESEFHEHKDAEFDGYVGFTQIPPPPDSNQEWTYYRKNETARFYEQTAKSDESGETVENETIILEKQIIDSSTEPTPLIGIFNQQPYRGTEASIIDDNPNYKGEYSETASYPTSTTQQSRPGVWKKYDVGDIVLYNDEYYAANKDFTCLESYWNWTWDENDWHELTVDELRNYFQPNLTIVENKSDAEIDDLCAFDNQWHICTGLVSEEEAYSRIQTPDESDDWFEIDLYNSMTVYHTGDLVERNHELYRCNVASTMQAPPSTPDWTLVTDADDFSPFRNYHANQTCYYEGSYYVATAAIAGVIRQIWDTDISSVIYYLIITDCNGNGEFDGNYMYSTESSNPNVAGDVCCHEGKYYVVVNDFSNKTVDQHPFNSDDWGPASGCELNTLLFMSEDFNLQRQAARTLCWTEDKLRQTIVGDFTYEPTTPNYNEQYSSIWSYGSTEIIENLINSIDDNTNIVQLVENNVQAATFLTSEEQDYLSLLIYEGLTGHDDIDVIARYIAIYRLLENIKQVKHNDGIVRDACDKDVSEEEMIEKNVYIDPTETEDCDNIWVDRGDGILIQLCNIGKDPIQQRFDAEKGEEDWNKLRYDQEYHFYRQFFADHPFVFERLQDKIKYFNPAFHSMTPEGFNARLTFLQQCTRQGNTTTKSDIGGKTANNLAFGRPPFCVLRLGDFYYQMIVIESISFDYSVSNGLQWDMNPEGNGMQPMLCKVNINFKFIGGGDITGPVRRLQNAMSFNYYANASFYDNRADRVVYQDTNWASMGGAGNNKVDTTKSYAYQAQNYTPVGLRHYATVTDSGTKTGNDTLQ